MKIVVLNNRYHLTGGPERYLFDMKERLERRGHEVIPFAVRYEQNEPSPYEDYFVPPPGGDGAVYFRDVKGPVAKAKLFARTVYSHDARKRLRKLLRDVKPDLVYVIIVANYLSPSVLLACRDEGIPVVMRLSDFHLVAPCYLFFDGEKVCEQCLHGSRVAAVKKRCLQGSRAVSAARVVGMKVHEKLGLYDAVDRFVAPSRFLRTKMIQSGTHSERIVHVPSFVDVPLDEPDVPPGDSLLYVGRLSPEKGVDRLLDAYRRAGSPGELRIVGSTNTPEAESLIERARAERVGKVTFLGKRGRGEIQRYLREARAVVVPSVCYENLPLAALEAMSAGRAVIAHDHGSLPEVVADGRTGFLCDPHDPGALAERIKYLMADHDSARRMGLAGRRKALAEFSPDVHVDALEALWSDLLGRDVRTSPTPETPPVPSRARVG